MGKSALRIVVLLQAAIVVSACDYNYRHRRRQIGELDV